MRVLVIGLGSIAKKHLAALNRLVKNGEYFALRSSANASHIEGITNLYNWGSVPADLDFILISNPTSEHLDTIKQCLEFEVPLFIEKPPVMNFEGVDELLEIVKKRKTTTYCAFNLRFHPVLAWLKGALAGKRVLEVQAYCGSYLPDWRPTQDYREVYSAKKELGGGVHLDLIHELDYLIWMFGKPKKTYSFLSQVSDLEIDTVDHSHYWMDYQKFNISVILNYFRRQPKRSLEIVMEDDTWQADLIQGEVTDQSGDKIFKTDLSPAITYDYQMQYFLDSIKSGSKMMNSLEEGIGTMGVCLN